MNAMTKWTAISAIIFCQMAASCLVAVESNDAKETSQPIVVQAAYDHFGGISNADRMEIKLTPQPVGSVVEIHMVYENTFAKPVQFTYTNTCPCLATKLPEFALLPGAKIADVIRFSIPHSQGTFSQDILGKYTIDGAAKVENHVIIAVSGVAFAPLMSDDGGGMEEFGDIKPNKISESTVIGQFAIEREPLAKDWKTVTASTDSDLFGVRLIKLTEDSYNAEIYPKEIVWSQNLIGIFNINVEFEFLNDGRSVYQSQRRTVSFSYKNHKVKFVHFIDFGDIHRDSEAFRDIPIPNELHIKEIMKQEITGLKIVNDEARSNIRLVLDTGVVGWSKLSESKGGSIYILGRSGDLDVLIRVPILWRCRK